MVLHQPHVAADSVIGGVVSMEGSNRMAVPLAQIQHVEVRQPESTMTGLAILGVMVAAMLGYFYYVVTTDKS
jgi:hypothetical protein